MSCSTRRTTSILSIIEVMETPQQPNSPLAPGRVERSLLTIDSSIRNGQFVYAIRETHKLLAELKRGEITAGDATASLISSLKRTSLFLKPMTAAYAQNQCSIGLIREKQCKTRPQT